MFTENPEIVGANKDNFWGKYWFLKPVRYSKWSSSDTPTTRLSGLVDFYFIFEDTSKTLLSAENLKSNKKKLQPR